MRLLQAATICWLGVVGSALAAQAPEPIATRQTAFAIPFRIEAPQDPALSPVEVRLYVSTDHGASWRPEASTNPQQTSFNFRAPSDGEYWFLIRTVDRQGRLRPDTGAAPELRVIVDTAPPRLDLKATRTASGAIETSWEIVDSNLNPASLRVEYQAGRDLTWREVALDSPRRDAPGTRVGGVTWWANGTKEPIAVRAQVTDAAGNLARTSVKAEAPAAAATGASPAAPIPNEAATPARPAAAPASTAWPARPSANAATAPPIPSATAPAPTPAAPRDAGQGPALPTLPERLPANPALTSEYQGLREAVGPLMPAGERPQMVNSKSFEMEYEVDAVGPSGIAKVELWGTRDSGGAWTSYGLDTDNRSPIRANVDGEGVFGFRISVQSGSGLGGLAPQSGDTPEVWVSVDLTAPRVRLIGADQGAGEQAGELIVRWEADDKALAARPISLSFSSQPGGPWYTIAAGLENTGVYGWRLDNRVPDRVWLRLEARDEAGNAATFESPTPTLLDRIRPEGRIRGVRPVESAFGG